MLPEQRYPKVCVGAEALGEALFCLFALVLELEEGLLQELVEELLVLERYFDLVPQRLTRFPICEFLPSRLGEAKVTELELPPL